MKKFVAVVLMLCLFVLAGCGEKQEISTKILEDGTIVTTSERGTNYSFKSFPQDMVINGNTIMLKSVEFFQDRIDHGYRLYAIVSLDMQGLTEDDIYWIDKDETLKCTVLLNSEENDYKLESLNQFASLDQGLQRRIAYYLSEEARYSFENAECTVSVDLIQEEKYTYKKEDGSVGQLNKRDSYSVLKQPVLTGNGIPTSKEIDAEMYEAMLNGMQRKLDAVKQLTK